MKEQLASLVLAFWQALNPAFARAPAARPIADAIAAELEPEADGARPPVYQDAVEDAAAMAYWAVRESSLDPSVPGDCRDRADPATCAAHGAWQLHGPCGRAPLREQARCWMALLRHSPCPEHPLATMWGTCSGLVPDGAGHRVPVSRLVAQRERRIGEVLATLPLPAVSEGQAPERLARVERLPAALVGAAQAYLGEGEPIGSERRVEVEGRPYLLVVEWHWHPDGYAGGPQGWHRGVSAFEVLPASRRSLRNPGSTAEP